MDILLHFIQTHLSCQEVVVSCPEEAFPLALLDQGAFPWEDPSEVACQEEVPSYLQKEGDQ